MSGEKRDFDRAAATWDQEQKRVKLAYDVADAIMDDVLLTPEMDMLDFGCGTGLLTLHLQPFVRSATGIDSSQGMLDALNAKIAKLNLSNIKTRQLDPEKGAGLTGSYHLITISMALHHIRDIQPLLDRFYEITAPAGHLCIADLDPDDGQFHGGDDTGVFHNGFDRADLRHAFEKAGYREVRDRTAARMTKPIKGGGTREFTIFLVTGRKPE